MLLVEQPQPGDFMTSHLLPGWVHSVTPSVSSVKADVDYFLLVCSQCVGVDAGLLAGNSVGSILTVIHLSNSVLSRYPLVILN